MRPLRIRLWGNNLGRGNLGGTELGCGNLRCGNLRHSNRRGDKLGRWSLGRRKLRCRTFRRSNLGRRALGRSNFRRSRLRCRDLRYDNRRCGNLRCRHLKRGRLHRRGFRRGRFRSILLVLYVRLGRHWVGRDPTQPGRSDARLLSSVRRVRCAAVVGLPRHPLDRTDPVGIQRTMQETRESPQPTGCPVALPLQGSAEGRRLHSE